MRLLKGDKFRVWLEPNGDIKSSGDLAFVGSLHSHLGVLADVSTQPALEKRFSRKWTSELQYALLRLTPRTIVIERLEALRTASDGAICVCYVYFRYSDRSEVTVRNVLEVLVKQVLERHPECLGLIQQTYAQHIREGSEPTYAQMLELLHELANRMMCTFYILDALDKAPTKIQLAVVKTLASLNVKLFITSRPLKTVEANFPEAHTFHIIAQEKDSDLHIAKRLSESAELQSLIRREGPSLKDEIVSTIKRNCGGM